MAKSLDKTNKKLKETDKTFGEIFKKIKLSGLMKMGAGVIGGAAGLAGVSIGGLLYNGLKNSGSVITSKWTGSGLGMSVAEQRALQLSSKLTLGDENKLTTALTGIVTALNRSGGSAAFSNLGLSQSALLKMKPEKALEEVFKAVKEKGKGMGREFARDAFMSLTGLGDIDFNAVVNQGASFSASYNEALKAYSQVDWDALARGAESMIKFQSQLDLTSDKIGAKLADPLARILGDLTPALETFATRVADFLDSNTKEDIDKFTDNLIKVMTAIGKVAGWIVETTTSEHPGLTSFEKREEARKKGDVLGYIGYDLKGGMEQFIGETSQFLWNGIFDPEQNIENFERQQAEKAREPEAIDYIFGAGTRAKMDKWVKDHLSVSVTAGGATKYVTGNYGGKLDITIKDPGKHVDKVESSIANNGTTKPPSPLRPGGRTLE